MSIGKTSSSSKQQSQQQQQQSDTGTSTPNNLSALTQGWNTASNLLAGTSANAIPNANTALNLINGTATSGVATNNNGAALATGYATPGGTTNGANAYLTPMASGADIGNNNPGFADMVKQLGYSLQPQADGAFGAAGRYGSGANANAFNTALDNTTGQLAYTNYNQSVQNQIAAASQLSTNNTNSTNQALQALGLLPNSTAASTAAAGAGYTGATAPLSTYAALLQALGAGGGTTTDNGTASGTGNTSGSSNTNSGGLSLSGLIQPFKLFG